MGLVPADRDGAPAWREGSRTLLSSTLDKIQLEMSRRQLVLDFCFVFLSSGARSGMEL